MRLHRFFIDEHLEGKREILLRDFELLNQWRNVLRLRADDTILLLDGSGYEYLSRIISLTRDEMAIEVGERKVSENISQKELTLFPALFKRDCFEWMIDKGTELGVSHFVPVISERSEKKTLNDERTRKIIKEASEQSGRGKQPDLHEVIELEKVFDEYLYPVLAFHPEGEKFNAEKFSDVSPLGILIGPEGGWSDREIEFLKSKNVPIYSLGSQVLRAETAAIAISTLLLL